MSCKDWYKAILERNITTQIVTSGAREPLLSRSERKHMEVDWKRTWETINVKGISGIRTTFLLRCLYDILPVKSRLNRLSLADSPFCDLCTHKVCEDLPHALLGCEYNAFANDWIIAVLIDLDPGLAEAELSSDNIVKLNLKIEDDRKFPVVWFLSLVLDLVWQARQARKPVSVTRMKALIGAEVSIMKETNLKNFANLIEPAINFSVSL